jgi:hypothetical protein
MVLTDGGVLNVASRDYVLNSDLNNARYITNDKRMRRLRLRCCGD